jgi:hypothetical protein
MCVVNAFGGISLHENSLFSLEERREKVNLFCMERTGIS